MITLVAMLMTDKDQTMHCNDEFMKIMRVKMMKMMIDDATNHLRLKWDKDKRQIRR